MARARPRARTHADRWARWTVSVADFRRLIDVAPDAYVAVAVEDPNDERPVQLDVNVGGFGIGLHLDYGTAGLLFDTLAQALSVVVVGQAQHKLGTDTPGRGVALSDASGSIQPRG